MKRRNFLRGLAAIAIAPLAALAKSRPEQPLPAKLKEITPRKDGMYAWAEHGFAVMDNRRILCADFGENNEVSEREDYKQFAEHLSADDVEYAAYTIPNCKIPTDKVIKGDPVEIRLFGDFSFNINDTESVERLAEALETPLVSKIRDEEVDIAAVYESGRQALANIKQRRQEMGI